MHLENFLDILLEVLHEGLALELQSLVHLLSQSISGLVSRYLAGLQFEVCRDASLLYVLLHQALLSFGLLYWILLQLIHWFVFHSELSGW